MAYFPNGTAGMILDEQCADCLPNDPCPIAWVQMDYNYDQCKDGQEKMVELLNCLVNEKGICQMKQYVSPRLPGKPKLHSKALQRKLVFGDEEQIAALNGDE